MPILDTIGKTERLYLPGCAIPCGIVQDIEYAGYRIPSHLVGT